MTTGSYEMISGEASLASCIVPTSSPNLDVVPTNLDLVGAEIELVQAEQRERKLRAAIEEVRDDYDFIILDCSPSLGLLTLNALTAADSVMVPVQCEYFCARRFGQASEYGENRAVAIEPLVGSRGHFAHHVRHPAQARQPSGG